MYFMMNNEIDICLVSLFFLVNGFNQSLSLIGIAISKMFKI